MVGLSEENLRSDIARRRKNLEGIMDRGDLSAILVPVAGAPRMNGLLRYFTNADLWAGKAYLLFSRCADRPRVLYASNYEAAWGEVTAVDADVETVETDCDPLERLLELVFEVAEGGGRLGVANADTHFSARDWRVLAPGFSTFELVDVTDDIDELRLIKSPFEVAAMQQLGRIMAEATDIYARQLRPGARAWAAGSMAEAHVKGAGGFRGWHKHSFGGTPFSMPTTLDRRLEKNDTITFELDYSGPYGYWCELSTVFSFEKLSEDDRRLLETTRLAIEESSRAAIPGVGKGVVGEVSDAVFRDAGYEVIGSHTRHCHTIGTDDLDRRYPLSDDDELREGMVLSFHPATLTEGGRAFLVSDNFLVTPEGAVPLSPREAIYRRIDRS